MSSIFKFKKPNIKANDISNEQKASLRKRIVYGAVMAAVAIPCLVLGGWFYLGLVFLVIGASTYEIAKAPSRKLSIFLWIVTFIIMYSLIFWIVFKENYKKGFDNFNINTSFTQLNLSPIALAVMIAIYCFVIVIKPEFILTDACYLIAMTLLLSLSFQAVLIVRYFPFHMFENILDINANSFKYGQSVFFMFYLLIAICFNDIGAYLVGVLFGKHKINPRISPNKTWEGFIGGIVISFIASTLFGFLVAYFKCPMLPNMDLSHFYWVILCSIILPFIGNLGDFTFSAIKRIFHVKDYSHVLGPHGGVLDRIDSILFGALALVILAAFINNNWDFFAK